MKALTRQLLNDFQRDFPLSPEPFESIARELQTSGDVVLEQLKALQVKGVVSRVGPVFRPNTIGVSTLAAMAVPAAELEQVAAVVNDFPQVNHNYEREHRYNLWFVATAGDRHTLERTLTEITERTGRDVMSLPLLKDYHIDLGFHMSLERQSRLAELPDMPLDANDAQEAQGSTGTAEDLIEAIQCGLPLVSRPYREIARRLGWSEVEVIEALRDMLSNGTIKRLGVVVRHHELGYRANAMVVWDVPDEQVDRLGRLLGDQDCVTLSYQRPRRQPDWPYNLFCMVHGRDRGEVIACIERMAAALDIGDIAHEVLFSGRRFRQRGARYRARC
mgnify:CR=1 FL=1